MFAAGLGHEMPAMLAVVAAIFIGLALGSWAGDRVAAEAMRPGRWYGLLEFLIGVWAWVTIALIPWCNEAVLKSTGLAPSAFRQWLIGFTLPALALLPVTVAMGATFPVMERFLAPLVPAGISVGGLYAANTLGAVTGVVVSTALVMPWLGLTKGLIVFSAISLVCGVTALLVERRLAGVREKPRAVPGPGSTVRLAAVLGMTGLLGIGYEVLGVRVLSQVLENTIYTFAAVLAVYLVGIALGAALYQARAARVRSDLLLDRLLMATSAASLLGIWILSHSPRIHGLLRAQLGPEPLAVWSAEMITAGLVFLGPTVLMGALFSHLVQSAKLKGLGIGRAVACNTLGCAIAPLMFGVVLLPNLGAKWAFTGLALAYLGFVHPFARARTWLAFLPILLLLVLLIPTDLRLLRPVAGERLLAHREGVMDSVSVVEHTDGNRSLRVNNRFTMGGTGAALAERRHADIPLLLHSNPKRALFLGLGTGITFAAAAVHSELKADGVELVPEIVDSLHWFEPHNTLAETRDRFKIHVADARRFVKMCPDRYDVIVADLFHPARDGAGALYSLEHFRTLRSRLAPGGLVCQWLPLFQLDQSMLRVIIRTFLEVFPDTRAFVLRFNVDTPVLGLIGELQPRVYRAGYFRDRVQDPTLAARMTADQLRDGYQLFGCFLAGPAALHTYSSGADLNTDDRPIVVFEAPWFNLDGRAKPFGRLMHLLEHCSSDPRELIHADSPADAEFAEALSGFVAARNIYLRGLAAEAEGNSGQAIDAYVESARASPLFSTGYAQCLTIAMQKSQSDPQFARELLARLDKARPERPVARELLKRISPLISPNPSP